VQRFARADARPGSCARSFVGPNGARNEAPPPHCAEASVEVALAGSKLQQ